MIRNQLQHHFTHSQQISNCKHTYSWKYRNLYMAKFICGLTSDSHNGIFCEGWRTWRRQIFFPFDFCNAHAMVNMLSFTISPTATYIISSVIHGATGSSIISWPYASTIGALKWWNPIWELAGIGLTTAMTRNIDGKVNDYCAELAAVSSHGHSTIHFL